VRRRRIVAAVLGVVLLVVVAVVAWYEIEANPSGPSGTAVVVHVARGEALDTVLDRLATAHVLSSSLAFRLDEVFHGTPSVAPGGYLFHTNLTFGQIRQVMAAGPDVYPLVVPAGFTVAELAERVGDLPGHGAQAFLATANSGAVRSPFQPPGNTSLEGLLGTGTYDVSPGETDADLLTAMVQRFSAQAARAGLTPAAAAALGLSEYQVVTAASVVQKEAYLDKNMGPVARVVRNRVSRGIPLQMDSTVLYSLGQDGGTVTPADLKVDTPYNTYLHTGLPPTPICFPSPIALAATLHAPPGDWLYFVVVDRSGTEAFADTYAQQQANERLAQSRGLP
jgi:UPF0755 protein